MAASDIVALAVVCGRGDKMAVVQFHVVGFVDLDHRFFTEILQFAAHACIYLTA